MSKNSPAPRAARIGTWVSAVTAVLLAAFPTAASAHTDLVATYPEAATQTLDPVTTVQLEFATPVQAEFTHVAVTGAGAVRVHGPTVEGTQVRVPVEGMAVAGEYRVAYRTVAADGHPVIGSYAFEVTTQAARAARPSAAGAERGLPGRRSDGDVLPATGRLTALMVALGLVGAIALHGARTRRRHG